jgi:hypothetical protein|tara:strand:- start:2431 stop:2691 length:261 start_codon:yes stop_codon:yes gene_type:complete
MKSYWNKFFRRPKGRKNAVRNEARAIPPSSYDDISPAKENFRSWRAAERMYKRGFSDEMIIRCLRNKWRIDIRSSYRILSIIKSRN